MIAAIERRSLEGRWARWGLVVGAAAFLVALGLVGRPQNPGPLQERPEAPPIEVAAPEHDSGESSMPSEEEEGDEVTPRAAGAWVDPEAASPDPLELMDAMVAVGDGDEQPRAEPTIELPDGRIRIPSGGWERIVHEVVPLETVERIAHRYGVRPDSVRSWNGLGPQDEELEPGTRLQIRAERISPPRMKLDYEVRPGDSWLSIGIDYGVDSVDLRTLSWGPDGPTLRVGQVLEIWIDPVVFQWIAVEGEASDDPAWVRPGAVGIGPPQDGRLVNGVAIPELAYWELNTAASYGTTHAVTHLIRGVMRFRARTRYERPLQIYAMSRRHGGPLPGHLSHQTGRDLDITLPLRPSAPSWAQVQPSTVDWRALWHLVTALAETGEVTAIFLDYALQERLARAAKALGATGEELDALLQWPHGSQAGSLVRHAHGHEAHIHVRFACGPLEPECVEASEGRDGG